MIDENNIQRFEYLAGRFLDGALTSVEDRELATILAEKTELAKRFADQVWLERLIIGCTERRQPDEEFAVVVRRGLSVLNEDRGSAQFARTIVKMVKARNYRRVKTQVRPGMRIPFIPISIAIASLCALVWLAAVLKSNGPVVPPTEVPSHDLRVENVDLNQNRFADDSQSGSHEIIKHDSADPALKQQVESSHVVQIPPAPVEPAQIEKIAPTKVEPEALALGRIGVVSGKGLFREIRNGNGNEKEDVLEEGATLFEGDKLRVPLRDTSRNELKDPNADVILADGSLLHLEAGTVLVMHSENGAQRPMLVSGEVYAHINHQVGHTLVISTRQGADAAVLGTVFRFSEDINAKKAILSVEEGRVQFSSGSEKHVVAANQFSVAYAGKAPSAPAFYRPRPAALSGIVTDKATGRPLANATVVVTPLAERKNTLLHRGTKTDVDGRFNIENLAEGAVFVSASFESASGVANLGAIARVKLIGGEKSDINLAVDKHLICEARVTENGKPVFDCSLRLISAAGISTDGQSLKIDVVTTGKTLPGEYFASTHEPPGHFSVVVEKSGFVFRVKGSNTVMLRPERMAYCKLEVQAASSAVVKGKVLNAANGAVLSDGPDVMADDATVPHTLLTLTKQGGSVQSAMAEADGTFAFDSGLDSGAYELNVERFGFMSVVKRFKLNLGENLELNIPLEQVLQR